MGDWLKRSEKCFRIYVLKNPFLSNHAPTAGDWLIDETEQSKLNPIRPNMNTNQFGYTVKSKIENHLILDDTRSMRSTQGRRPRTNDYEDLDIDNESQRI
jgi:hypothetical protein